MNPASRPTPTDPKRRRLLGALVLSLAALVSACAGFQRPDEGADFGLPPLAYQDAARAHLETDLPIPTGSRFSFGEPVKAYANNGLAVGGEVAWMGYIVDVAVSSPDTEGVYGDPLPYMVFFRNDHVSRTLEGNEHPLVHRVE